MTPPQLIGPSSGHINQPTGFYEAVLPFKLQFNQNGCGERNALIIFHASFSKRRANGRFTSHLGVISLSASYPTSSAVGTYSSRGRTYIYGLRNKRTAGSTLSSTHRPTDSEPRNGVVAVAPVHSFFYTTPLKRPHFVASGPVT